MIRKSTGSLLLMLALPTLAHAVEILRWERIPLAIPLTVGQERIVFVDRNVRVGVPRDLQGKLRVQSTGGARYLLRQRADSSSAPAPAGRDQWRADAHRYRRLRGSGRSTAARAGQDRRRRARGSALWPAPGSPAIGSSETDRAGRSTEGRAARNARPRGSDALCGADALCPTSHGGTVDGVGQVRVKRQLDLNTLLPQSAHHGYRLGRLAAGRLLRHGGEAAERQRPAPGPGSQGPDGQFHRRNLPAPVLGTPGRRFRHHHRVSGDARPRPCRRAPALRHQPDRSQRRPSWR